MVELQAQSRPKVLLTGVHGQLGEALARHLQGFADVTALDRQACDLTDVEALRAWVQKVQPDFIVNPAAYTAVDKAETEPELAFAINATAPLVLAEEAKKIGAWLIHYSTDYVFNGKKDGWYTEQDICSPQSVYGASKLAGEQAIAATGAKYCILRTSWVVGQHGGNFAKTILRLASERSSLRVIADQFGAPTSAELLAEVTLQILQTLRNASAAQIAQYQGIYHLAAAGETTWHAYAQHVVAAALAQGKTLALTPAEIEPIAASEYPLPATRPTNSRLDTTHLRTTFGVDLPTWQEALAPVLTHILRS